MGFRVQQWDMTKQSVEQQGWQWTCRRRRWSCNLDAASSSRRRAALVGGTQTE